MRISCYHIGNFSRILKAIYAISNTLSPSLFQALFKTFYCCFYRVVGSSKPLPPFANAIIFFFLLCFSNRFSAQKVAACVAAPLCVFVCVCKKLRVCVLV